MNNRRKLSRQSKGYTRAARTTRSLRRCASEALPALYERDSKTNALISGLTALPRELTAKAAIRKRADPGYIPSECLVYPHPYR
jgi:hypothetical protein